MKEYFSVKRWKEHAAFWQTQLTTCVIWLSLPLIFIFDVLTRADKVSVSFAYSIPILVSLFERNPRPLLYASIATALSVLGSFIHPPSDANPLVLFANRLLAILMQWAVAGLVALQHRRLLEARQRAETQRRFVDILSHEIGTALTAVTGQAFRLRRVSAPLEPSDLRQRADKLRKAAERIQAIISRIQIASSFGDGSIPVGNDCVDIQAMIKQLVQQMREEHKAGPIELQPLPSPPMVMGDEMMLRHVFENVILNAIKYSPSNSPISVAITEKAGGILVSVRDRGSGIAKSELSHIRTPYYRGDNSVGISGAGLGLYVVERLVEAHHGHVTIESEPNVGTTLKIELPMAVIQ